jgi:hypothetical protein
MKKEKSLCESCSNRVVIKYRKDKNGKQKTEKEDCFYNFKIFTSLDGQYGNYHVSNFIIDSCSFYNKSAFCIKTRNTEKERTDSDDSNESNKGVGGVTFTNIPGALLP